MTNLVTNLVTNKENTMTTTPAPGARARAVRRTTAVAGAALLLLTASACGTANKAAVSAPTGGTGAQTVQQGPPGVDGTVAAVTGSTAQVQNPQTGQVAVSWTGSTRFTQQVAASLSAVKAGECVMVAPTQTSASASSQPTSITAATVRISKPVNGSCAAFGRGGPGGGRPSFSQGAAGGDFTPPSGAPSGFPSGGPGRGRTFGGFGAFGTVTAVSGTGFTVKSVFPSGGGASTGSTSVSVSVNGSTSYTTDAAAHPTDVKVGVCLRAQGSTDSTGAVTARTIALSQPVGGQCTAGFFRAGGPDGAGSGPKVQGF